MDVENLIEFTQALVQRQSLSGQEQTVAQRVQEELQSLHFDQVQVDENGSVIGIIEGAQPGKTLLLDAHTDTVGIAPGVFETPMTLNLPPASRDVVFAAVPPFPPRAGRAEEFAALALSIIGNPMLNGEVIRLDGAIRMGTK